MLAKVDGVFNAVVVRGDAVGETLYYGRGAGRRGTFGHRLLARAQALARLLAGPGRRRPAGVQQHCFELAQLP